MCIRKGLASILGLLVLVLVFEVSVRLIPWLPDGTRWPSATTYVKADQLRHMDRSIDTLFLGSSSSEAAIDPALFDRLTSRSTSYNAAFPFYSPAVGQEWIRATALSDVQPALVVIGLTVKPGHTEESAKRMMGYIRSARRFDDLVNSPRVPHLLSKRGVLTQWDRLAIWNSAQAEGLWTEQGHFRGYYDEEHQEGDPLTFLEPEPKLSPMEAEALLSVATHFRDNGVRVILLVERWLLPAASEKAVVREFRAWLSEFGDAYGLPVWDSYELNWPREVWADQVHVNSRGTTQFTEYIAEMARSLESG